MRKLATIRTINSIEPIPDADAIELARIDGWQVVVKKGDFHAGDSCVYCEIDSVLPAREEFEFLRKNHFRIRTVKMRKVLSQGIAFPLTILNGHIPEGIDIKLDDDVTEYLGIVKYEPNIPACLAGTIRGTFPTNYFHKTDEERIQNFSLKDINKILDTPLYVTEKIDGSSVTYGVIDGEFHVCSRNMDLKPDDKNAYWQFAIRENLEEKLLKYCSDNNIRTFCIQGELIGPGIQKNKYKQDQLNVLLFYAYNADVDLYLGRPNFVLDICCHWQLTMVPYLYYETYTTLRDILSEATGCDINGNIDQEQRQQLFDILIAMADGKSALTDGPREGLVFRCPHSMNSANKVSFKVISNAYLLKEE